MNYKKLIKKIIGLFVPKTVVQAKVVTLASSELLKGRTALITGGTSGIGYAIAKGFIMAGANVIITGRNRTKIDKTVKLLQTNVLQDPSTVKIDGYVLDVSLPDISSNVTQILDNKIGKIDILVNNAGVLGCNINDGTIEQWDSVINTNIRGAFFLSQAIGTYMKDNHIKGNILNIASSSSLRPAISAYTISKWGLRGLTLGLAKALIPHGIVVNGIAPGPTATPMLLKEDDIKNVYNSTNPTGRYATPEEIANMAVMLVSDVGRMIVGDVIYMTGGAGLITFDDLDYTF